jgi:drug/metabolite transporter (DMT)-like permease
MTQDHSTPTHSRWSRATPAGFAMVAAGAALWGTDALFRRELALDLPSSFVVFAEHLILVALTIPFLLRARRWVADFTRMDWIAVILVGVGASATATFLFTASFRYGDPTTTLLLQKLQPLFVVIGARLLLGERFLPRYAVYFVLALSGAYFITFADPASATVSQLAPALLSVGAAALWGMGTVLGRHLSGKIPFAELTSLRFAVGLPATALLVFIDLRGEGWPTLTGNEIGGLFLLSLVPGLIALMLYYRGLTSTPASAATIAELAFPLTALAVNYLAFDTVLTTSQWIGFFVLAGTVTVMGLSARSGATGMGIVTDERPEPASVGASGG